MALAERVVDKKYIKHLKCSACDDIFSNPRMLKRCSHVFCLLCITNCNQEGNDVKTRCPVVDCQTPFTSADISTRMLQL